MNQFLRALSQLAHMQAQINRILMHTLHEKEAHVSCARDYCDQFLDREFILSIDGYSLGAHMTSVYVARYVAERVGPDDPEFEAWNYLVTRANTIYARLEDIQARAIKMEQCHGTA